MVKRVRVPDPKPDTLIATWGRCDSFAAPSIVYVYPDRDGKCDSRVAAEGMRERDPLAVIHGDRRPGQSDPEAARVDARRYFRELWAMVPVSSRPVMERVVLEDQAVWSGGGSVARDRHMSRLKAGLDAIA